jgi:hypothetical protein
VPEELGQGLPGVGGGLGVGVAPGELGEDVGEVSLACGEEKDVLGGVVARSG